MHLWNIFTYIQLMYLDIKYVHLALPNSSFSSIVHVKIVSCILFFSSLTNL